MDRSGQEGAATPERMLAAVAEYLRLLDAEWDALTDPERRRAVALALEAATTPRGTGAGGGRDGPRRRGVRRDGPAQANA